MACFKLSIITWVICTLGLGLALGLYAIPTFLGSKEVPCAVTDCRLGRCSRSVYVRKGVYRTVYYDCLKLTVELQIESRERWVFDRVGTCPASGTMRTCYYIDKRKKETISLDPIGSTSGPFDGAIATATICGFVWLCSLIWMICTCCCQYKRYQDEHPRRQVAVELSSITVG